MPKMQLFIPVQKIDEEKRLVYGVMTSSALDRSGEKLNYAGSKPYIKAWSDSVKNDSQGKSVGNVRYMHQAKVAGHLNDINFNDGEQQVEICAKITDDQAWKQVQEGDLTGFSIGGEYVDVKKVGKITEYVASPVEVSVVDRPCVPNATFAVIKADGSTLTKNFMHYETPSALTPEQRQIITDAVVKAISEIEPTQSQPVVEVKDEKVTPPQEGKEEDSSTPVGSGEPKPVEKMDCGCEKADDDHQQVFATHNGTKVPKSEHAYAPEGSKPSEWKLPIHDKAHVQNALARFNQVKGLSPEERAKAHAKIVAAAQRMGIHVSSKHAKAAESLNLLTSVPYIEQFASAINDLQKTLSDLEKDLGSMENNMDSKEHMKQACEMAKALHAHLEKGIAGAGSAEEASAEHGGNVKDQPKPAEQPNDIGKGVSAAEVQTIVEKTVVGILEKMFGSDATTEKSAAGKGNSNGDKKVEKSADGGVKKDASKAAETDEEFPEPGAQYNGNALHKFASKLKGSTELPEDIALAMASR